MNVSTRTRLISALLILILLAGCAGGGKLIGKYPHSNVSTIGEVTTTETYCILVYENEDRSQYEVQASALACDK